MTNKILIDGWNVAWKIDDIRESIPEDLPKARTKLNSRVKSFFSGKKSQFKIIYDGKSGMRSEENYVRGIDIQFSKDPEKADHLIIKFLRSQHSARQWTVITSDRTLSAHARSLGASVISSETFIEKLAVDHGEIPTHYKHNPQLNGEEIKFWMEQFHADKKKEGDP